MQYKFNYYSYLDIRYIQVLYAMQECGRFRNWLSIKTGWLLFGTKNIWSETSTVKPGTDL